VEGSAAGGEVDVEMADVEERHSALSAVLEAAGESFR
jgi:hypothetical protein